MLSAELFPVWFSDHTVLSVCVDFSVTVFGGGYWKLNAGILGEAEFTQTFREMYRGWVELRPCCSSVVSWWEGIKEKVAVLAKGYCRWKRRRELGTFRTVRRRLQELYGRWNGGGQLDTDEVDRCMGWQRRWCEDRAREFRFRAQKEVFEEDEQCSTFFFSSIKAASSGSLMTGLRGEDGALRSDAQGMMNVATAFYRHQFSEQEVDEGMGEYFFNFIEARVPEAVRAVM